jgi:hypothetical protein
VEGRRRVRAVRSGAAVRSMGTVGVRVRIVGVDARVRLGRVLREWKRRER